MKVVGILLFVALAIFVVYLLIDTTIYVVKKVKAKKQEKMNKENVQKDDEVINGDVK